MTVPYDYYRIFYYVAKYQSFTKAAAILMNNQPNVTRTMNKLEQELGCRLFVRSNRGVSLTAEGEKLFAHVQIAEEQLRAGENEILRGKSLESGSISIGASEMALHGLLLPVLRSFRLSYPGIHIGVTNHSTPQAVAAVKSGLVDFAVVTSPTGAAKPLIERRLVSFQDILVAGTDFSSLRGHLLHLSDLDRYPLICLGKDTKTWEFFNQLFASYNLKLQPDIEAATTDQILPMVKHGLGLGFLPKKFAAESIEKGEILEVKLAEPIPKRYICLIQDRTRPIGLASQELIRMLSHESL